MIGGSVTLDAKDVERSIKEIVESIEGATLKIATSMDVMVSKIEKGFTGTANAAKKAVKEIKETAEEVGEVEDSYDSVMKSLKDFKKELGASPIETAFDTYTEDVKQLNEELNKVLPIAGALGAKLKSAGQLQPTDISKLSTGGKAQIESVGIEQLNIPALQQYMSILQNRVSLGQDSLKIENQLVNAIDKAKEKLAERQKTDRQIQAEKEKADDKELARLIKLEAENNRKYEKEFAELVKLEAEKEKAIQKEIALQEKLKQERAVSALGQYDVNISQGTNIQLMQMKEFYSRLEQESKNYQMTLYEINALEEDSVENVQKKVQALQQFQTKQKVDITDPESIAENEKLLKQIDELQAKLKKLQTISEKPITPKMALDMPSKTIEERTAKTKALQQARSQLDTTDEKNTQTLKQLNRELFRLDEANKKALTSGVNLENQTKKMSLTAEALTRRLAYYFSITAAVNFAKQLVNIRGEFELQQKALASIIQNKDEADKLFARITQLAVQSPFQLKDLVGYTKQLAAYRIETERLFDTTKMLADVSAGLGVDMGRLILAYGQVRAASVLRGQELRQFTEAGIPIIDELAKKFTVLEGRAVSAGEVFEKVSNRMVSFKMVDEIFQDMTKSGGIFYRMQEIQAETLKGKVSNLVDAYQLMLNEIGKGTEGTLKGGVDLVRSLLENYEKLIAVLSTLLATYGTYKIALFITNQLKKDAIKWTIAETIALIKQTRATDGVVAATKLANSQVGIFRKLILTMVANPYIAIATAIIGVATAIGIALYQSGKLNRELNKITETSLKNADQQSRGFDRLADRLRNATKGSDAFNEALKEMNRTYGEYLPNLLTENNYLTELDKNYNKVVDSIYNKAKASALEKGFAEIEQTYGQKQIKAISQIRKELEKVGIPSEEAQDILKIYQDRIDKIADSGEDAADRYIKAFNSLTSVVSEYYAKDSEMKSKVSYIPMYNTLLGEGVSDLVTNLNKQKKAEKELIDINDVRFKKATYNNLEEKKLVQPILDKYDKLNKNTANTIAMYEELAVAYRNAGNEFKAVDYEKKVAELTKETANWLGIVEKITDTNAAAAFVPTEEEQSSIYKYIDRIRSEYSTLKKQQDDISRGLKADKSTIDANKEQLSIINKISKALNFQLDLSKEKGKNKELEALEKQFKLVDDITKKFKELVKETGSVSMSAEKTKEAYQKFFDDIMPKGFDIGRLLTFNPQDIIRFVQDLSNKLKTEQAKLAGTQKLAELTIAYDIQVNKASVNEADKTLNNLFSGYELSLDIESTGEFGGILVDLFKFKPIDINQLENEVAKVLTDLSNQISDYQQKKEDISIILSDPTLLKKDRDELTATLNEIISAESDAYKKIEDTQKKLDNTRQDYYRKVASSFDDLYRAHAEYQYRILDIDKRVAKEQLDIQKSFDEKRISEAQATQLKIASTKRGEQEKAKVEFEKFKDTDEWIMAFEDMDRLSSRAINSILEKLTKFKDEQKDLSPTEIREVTNAFKKLREAAEKKDILGTITSGFKEFIAASKDVKKYNEEVAVNTEKLKLATENANNAEKDFLDTNKNAIQTGRAYTKALKERNKAQSDLDESNKKLSNAELKQANARTKTVNGLNAYASALNGVSSMMSQLVELFGIAEDSELGVFMQDLSKALGLVATALGVAAAAMIAFEAAALPILAIGAAVAAVIASILFFTGKKQRRIEKELEKSELAVKKLESAYEDLGRAIDKAYSREGDLAAKNVLKNLEKQRDELAKQIKYYEKLPKFFKIMSSQKLGNLRKQYADVTDALKMYSETGEYNAIVLERLKIANIELQKAEIQRQIQLEKSKKKVDKKAVADLENQLKDLDYQTAEVMDNIVNTLMGTDVLSAANDFADSWITAWKEGADTMELLEGKFDDMIQNMIVKSLASKIVALRLRKMWDMVDEFAKDNVLTPEEIKAIGAEGKAASIDINKQMIDLMGELGILFGEAAQGGLSGLQKGIQGITEETALALESVFNSVLYQSYIQSEHLSNILSELQISNSGNSQMLLIARESYQILVAMRQWQESITKAGHPDGGNGIKAFIN